MRALRFLLALALLLASHPALARVQRFALLVGNDTGHAPDAPLRYAETDAAKVAQVLRDLGGFEPADIVVLRGENADTVRRSLISLNDRIRAVQALPGQQALLFVYYSGHGDAQALRLGNSRLEFRELAQLVRGSSASVRLLVVDACRSGALTRLKGGRVVAPFDLGTDASLPGEGMAFLTASAENEDAQESDELRGSFFTHAFVSGLMGAADRNGDGSVALDEAYAHARDATIRATSRTFSGPQHPSFHFELRGQDSLPLTQLGLSAQQRGLLSFRGNLPFMVLARDASGPVVAEVDASNSRRLSLRAGRYFVRARASDHLLEGEVAVTAGAQTSVEPDQLRRVDYARLVRKGAGIRAFSHALELQAAGRTALVNADTPCWGGAVGYRLELPELSLGLRLGACHSRFEGPYLDANTDEYSAAAELRHTWDLTTLSVFLAADLGMTLTRQGFSRPAVESIVSTSPLGALGGGVNVPLSQRYFATFTALAELQLMRFKPTGYDEPQLRWAFAPKALLGAGAQF